MKTETIQALFLAGIALNAELIPADHSERELITALAGFKYFSVVTEMFANGALIPILENAYNFLELYAVEKYPHLKEPLTILSATGHGTGDGI